MKVSVTDVAAKGAAVGAPAEVRIVDYQFVPANVMVKTGTTVRWVNGEKRASHSVLFLGANGLESERIFPGESWSRTFDEPGHYDYRCGPHAEMRGHVEVIE